MRAIEVSEFGGPEVLRPAELPGPVPGAGQLGIEVVATGVLGIDTVIRAGNGQQLFPVECPYVPGAGAAGVVTAVGDGVDPGWRGTRVVAELGSGGYADTAVADLEAVLPIPEPVGFLDAMAMLHDGRTAIAVLEEIGVKSGETVLVTPAAGGLGSTLVQLAAAAGARVVAVARGRGKLAVLRERGADLTVDYAEPAWPQRLLAAVGEVDVAFDGVGGPIGTRVADLVRDGGRYSNYGFAGNQGPSAADRDGLTGRGVTVRGMEQLSTFAEGRFDRGRRALELVADGTIRPLIGAVLPLEQAALAHRLMLERNTSGKILLLA